MSSSGKKEAPATKQTSANTVEDANQLEGRKADHIRINVEKDVDFKAVSTGLEKLYFLHKALPELNYTEVDTSTTIFNKRLSTPLLISSMTGGTDEALAINRTLAAAAQEVKIAMGLGSVRAAIADPKLAKSYQVRDAAPDILLFANLGAVQLNYGYGLHECLKAVEICQADALILHFNPLQEAVQPEGDGDFSDLYRKIEKICSELPVPVIAKEVGWGFDQETASRLVDTGIAAIDVAGAGGTSWSQVEMHRAPTARHARVAGAFIDWGIPTADSIRYCRDAALDLPIFASGGLKDGIDVAKCIALGASMAGFAGQFLRAAVGGGVEAVIDLAGAITDELRVAMFCSGAGDIRQLGSITLHERK